MNKNSEYSAKKYEEQYKQSQRYKKMLCHYNSIDFATSKNNNEPIVQSCNFCSTKKSDQKLPKVGFGQKSNTKCFRTTISRGGPFDERYYKEATRSRKMSSTTRSKFRNTRYDDKKIKKEKKRVILMKKVMKEVVRIKKYREIKIILIMAVLVVVVVEVEKEVN